MSHHAATSGFAALVERLNRGPQGAPPSDLLFRILKLLMSEQDAQLLAMLPMRPFTAERAAKAWGVSEFEAERRLQRLADRALIVDVEHDGRSVYTLPPPMAGFFEFSMMRVRGDIDQPELGRLLYHYLNVEDDFIRNLFCDGETQLGRVFVHEPALPDSDGVRVLDYERASAVIQSAEHIAVGLCYCRHKMQHVGRDCDAPKEICMTFAGPASSLIKHGHARRVDAAEGMDLLQQAYDCNLVQFGDNVRENVTFICHCCGCCCEGLLAAQRFSWLHPVHTTNFVPAVSAGACVGCGRCVRACPVDSMELTRPVGDAERGHARVDEDTCLGCGLCVRACAKGALTLTPRAERVLTPVNTLHRVVLMAIERGKLQNLIFDNHVLSSHRALAALLGVILQLPPIQRALASEQMKSRYLEALALVLTPLAKPRPRREGGHGMRAHAS